MKIYLLILLTASSFSCYSQEKNTATGKIVNPTKQKKITQIGKYVTGVFEDSNGNLWFGTIEKGIAKYDGNQLKYFTKKDGLPSNRVTSVTEDTKGVLWFNTGEGIVKYDDGIFTTYRIEKDDWQSNSISQFFIDSKENMWVGTWGGVYQFDGEKFNSFLIPYPQVETPINEDTKNWITEIKEDYKGNMWFARDGFGACKYDGKSFTHILKRDGLHSNNVTEIEFDSKGNIWFATRVAEKDNPDPEKRVGKGGLNRMTNGKISSFPNVRGLYNGDVYEIHIDDSDKVWISTTDNGVYRFDGESFKNYNVPISIMNIMDDKKGNLWLAGAGGLYRINQNNEVINVTTNGPWK